MGLWVLLAWCAAGGGCGSTPDEVTEEAPPLIAAPGDATSRGTDRSLEEGSEDGAVWDGRWPFRPRQVRVYPLTRFYPGEEGSGGRLEARVEFADRDGDTVKAVGLLSFDLWAASGPAGGRVGERVGRWEVDLTDLEVNALHYDSVTRTYRCDLQMPQGYAAPEFGLLRVTLESVDGRRLESEAVVELR